MENYSQDLSRELVKEFVDKEGTPVQSYINTYNEMFVDAVANLVASTVIPTNNGSIKFENVTYQLPATTILGKSEELLPVEAFNQNKSYLAPFYVDVRQGKNVLENVCFMHAPVYIRSKLDNTVYHSDLAGQMDTDPGGYFIIEGGEKVVIPQIRLQPNVDVIFMENAKRGGRLGNHITCLEGSITRKTTLEVFTPAKTEGVSSLPTVRLITSSLTSDDTSEIRTDPGINVAIIFRILRQTNKEELIDYLERFVPTTNLKGGITQRGAFLIIRGWLQATFDEGYNEEEPELVLVRKDKSSKRIPIAERRSDAVNIAINNLYQDLFPHIPKDALVEKTNLLCRMLVRLALVENDIIDIDNRDDWKYVFIRSAPLMMMTLFTQIWNRVTTKDIGVNATLSDVNRVLNADATITQQLISAIRSGKWSVKGTHISWEAITEELNRLNPQATITHLTRIIIPAEKRGAQFQTRLNIGSKLMSCFAHTPDSEAAGLTRHLGSLTRITTEVSPDIVWAAIEQYIQPNYPDIISSDASDMNTHLLLLNGRPRAWCNGSMFTNVLRSYRRQGLIPPTVSISLESDSVMIKTLAGRMYIPCLVIEKEITDKGDLGKLVIDTLEGHKWDFATLLVNGAIEYIDTHELSNIVLAPSMEDFRDTETQHEIIKHKLRNVALSLLDEWVELPASMQDEYLNLSRKLYEQGLASDRESTLKVMQAKLEDIRSTLVRVHGYTHVVMSTSFALGLSAATIPYLERIQGPRILYQCNINTQAVTTAPVNADIRFDASTKNLYYSQAPLAHTQQGELLGLNKYPRGVHLKVGVMPFGGMTIEDAIIINKTTVERGALMQYNTKVKEAKEEDLNGVVTVFYKPPPRFRGKKMQTKTDPYRFLDRDGIIAPGTKAVPELCVIGALKYVKDKTIDARKWMEQTGIYYDIEEKIQKLENKYTRLKQEDDTEALERLQYHERKAELQAKLDEAISQLNKLPRPDDASVYVEWDEGGVVDKVLITNAENVSNRLVKVKLIEKHNVMGGDKFSPQCGQKGTASAIYPNEDMPFIGATGEVLDMIINTPGIVGRMTPSMLVEMLSNHIAGERGTRTRADAFQPILENYEVIKTLQEGGFTNLGRQQVYSGKTGHKMWVDIMVAPIYQSALKHHAADKFRVRGMGHARDPITKQAVRGRRRIGGIHFGEQEGQVTRAHGMAEFMSERLSSDSIPSVWCIDCGCGATFADRPARYVCNRCGGTNFGAMEVPGAYRYVEQLMTGMGVLTQLKFRKEDAITPGVLKSKFSTAELIPSGEKSAIKAPLETEGEGENFFEMNALIEEANSIGNKLGKYPESAGISEEAIDSVIKNWYGDDELTRDEPEEDFE